ncbi:1-(5-phosphoribosyl)-5-[(5-phosphoribosylamino)methylideneamino] imidazole-4-carboxamide isomerase [Rodentibacter pneumotropicus]|uniref:1-(5-phosphoribosyl)-5-[(5-phosphoribosylamino)methylideneamino] imidazole-4-carboxamide isomerase n=1 Tax=Rodentibacter pneumotropicus TaxID=758 RepID=A0A448MIU5_9PAST|nr:1-(5-phosphoribosyl)-5-[(5-phosphoribosylamino)methylideneamino] imidazole-4-carboxamide isomerase [Rodentibacter pneumotropicus]
MQTSQIIPALDLIDGQVVRLYQGDYAQKPCIAIIPWHNFRITCVKGQNNFIWWI